MKKFILFVTFCIFNFSIFCQTPSIIENIRFPLWAMVDAYPGIETSDPSSGETYDYPIDRIRELAPYLVNGMVYGWDFVYVPSDKARGVDEYFEIISKNPGDDITQSIQYSSPWIEDNKFNCWVNYKRTNVQVTSYNLWASIRNPVIHGRGFGPLADGFTGIEKATQEAVKNAIREHYRTKYKNKPKEISGSVLLRKTPTLGIDQGRYVINLDFFLEYGRIKQYTQF